MKNLLVLALILISSTSFAQQFRVEKVKGNKAVIQFSGTSLSQGGTYSIGGGSSSTRATGSGSRDYVIGGSFGYYSGSDTTEYPPPSTAFNSKNSSSDLSLLARFGWNKETYEAGAILKYRNVDSDYTFYHYNAFSGGGFYDYNFSPNRPGGDSMIYSVTAEATFGSFSPKGGSGGSAMDYFLGGSMKWFGLNSNFAIRTDLGYSYQKISPSGGTLTSQGFGLRAGIASYF